MAGFFEKFIQTGIEGHHKGRLYDALYNIKYEEVVPTIKNCCSHLREGFSREGRSYHPVADRQLAERIMKCIEEWDYESSIISLKEVISKEPNNIVCLSLLSSQYSGCPIDKFRNGEEAVKLACKTCELTKYKDALELMVLAQAYAECGDFEKAVEYQKKSNKLADDPQEYKERLAAYKARKPWRIKPQEKEGENE